jgi:hypothetical protein
MARVGEAGTAVIVLDVRPWPLDGNQWIARTAEALKAAGEPAEAVDRWTRMTHGLRMFDGVVESCRAVLARHYEVKA